MNKTTLRNTTIAAMLTAAVYAPASSAIVKEQSVRDTLEAAPAVTVDYSDLDIARGSGVEVLYQRLRSAARSVCGSSDARNISASQQWNKCYDEALDAAVARVNNERLTQLHRG